LYEIGHRITKLDSQLGAAGRAENYLLPPRAARHILIPLFGFSARLEAT
jgi:hypothetical protein